MADEVNQFAFDGGDTEPETAALIKSRNEALQTLSDKNREVMQTVADAHEEAYANAIEAENTVFESDPAFKTGDPVVTPPNGEAGTTGNTGTSSPQVAAASAPAPKATTAKE